ncbi:MAG: PEP-CTERM sorting domain-containing protein, partial [Planctomycetota bacterium]
AAAALFCTAANGAVISEFEPNPTGTDPSTMSIELSGTIGESFSYQLYSIENDGFNGTVDRFYELSGTFDANGLAVLSGLEDLENPSFTLILSEGGSDLDGQDLDAANDGNLDTSNLGTILDVVGVSDGTGDNDSLYSNSLGGTSILFNGQFEPLTAFRSGSSGEFFNTVTVDFGDPTERLGVFDAAGNEVDENLFDFSPFGTTYGSINATFTAIPEPSALIALAAISGGVAVRRRRRS